MICATEISGVAMRAVTRNSCRARAPPRSMGKKSSLKRNRSARLVRITPAIIADRNPGRTMPALPAQALIFSPRKTEDAITRTLLSSRSIEPASGSAGAAAGLSAKVTSDGAPAACSLCRAMIQPVIGPDTKAPATTASVEAPTPTTVAPASPCASSCCAQAIAVPGPPTKDRDPASTP